MSNFNIYLFGRFEIFAGDQAAVECFHSQKALELFCFLVLFHNQPHHREYLAELFWGQRCTAEAKKYLRKTLWQLQSTLEQLPGPSQADLICIDTDWLQFNREGNIWLDVLEFERIYTSLSGFRGRNFSPQQFYMAQRAVDLYRGELLEGYYQDWCVYERERLKDMYLGLVDKLMGYCEVFKEYEAGIHYGRRLLVLDWARESTHLRLMRLYHLAGDRTSALRQYEACRDALRQEFKITPGEQVMELYHQLVNTAFEDRTLKSSRHPGQTFDQQTNSRVNAALNRIRELIALQASIPEQITEELQIIAEAFVTKD